MFYVVTIKFFIAIFIIVLKGGTRRTVTSSVKVIDPSYIWFPLLSV